MTTYRFGFSEVPDEPAWYTDHRNLYQVAGAMLEDDYGTGGVLDMLAKPWKYTDIYLWTLNPVDLTFAKGDRVVRRSSEDAPLNRVQGTVMTDSSAAQPTAAVIVHWDGFGPDHLVTVNPAELRKVAAATN